MCIRKLKKQKQEEASPWKYAVTIEEVLDKEMPNGEVLIDHLIKAHQDLSHNICREQSWNKNAKKIDKLVEELIPEKYHEHLSMFLKKESERMPLQKPWDHGIELKEEFILRKLKVYPLSPLEQTEVDDFISEQLRKGYITGWRAKYSCQSIMSVS